MIKKDSFGCMSNYLKIHLAFISLFLYSWVIAKRIEPKDFIYSSQHSIKHDKIGNYDMISNIKVAEKANLIFISAGKAGIKVVDPNKNHDIIYTYKADHFIDAFEVTKDANYIFIPQQTIFTIFDFSNRKEFNMLTQVDIENNITDILINNEQNILFLFSINGIIYMLNISNLNDVALIDYFHWFYTQIFGSFISPDDKWLFICQGIKGLAIYNIEIDNNGFYPLQQAAIFKGTQSNSQGVVTTHDMKYIINIDNRLGVSVGDMNVIATADQSDYPLNLKYILLNWWPTQINLPSPYSLCVSTDNNFLYLGVLSQGIFFVDISDIQNPSIYGTTYISFHGKSIKLSPDQQYLYYANSWSFYVFPKVKPYLSDQYINLYNNHLSTAFQESKTKYHWRCIIDDKRNLYFGAFNNDGLWIIDVEQPHNMKTLTQNFFPLNQIGYVDALYFFQNRYLVVPLIRNPSKYIIAVYDTMYQVDATNKYSLEFIQGVEHDSNKYIVSFDTNYNETLLAGALANGIIFFDITTPGDYKFLYRWFFDAIIKGECTGIMITLDDKHLIGANRGFSYYILDIQDLLNIKLIGYYDSLGAESVIYSNFYNDFCYFFDGLEGIFIVNITDIYNINIISNINVPGWSNDITFLKNETQMLISSLEQGMLTLVDISDIKNPFIVSTFVYEDQNGMSSCSYEDNSYLFVNNNIEVRALPTKLDVLMHIELQQQIGLADDHKSFLYQRLNPEDKLKVGQIIKININHLYQPYDITIIKVLYYQYQIMSDLPSWITFDPNEYSIKLNIVKEEIDPTNTEKPLLNVIIIKTANPLFQNNFIFTDKDCITDDNKSKMIYDYIFNEGLINDRKFLQPELEDSLSQNIIVDGYPYKDIIEKKCLSKQIRFTLLNSIQYSPIYLFMVSSLILNLNAGLNMNYIETIAKLISINILIPKNSGKFIFQNQISVTISINEDRNQISVVGGVQDVNKFLKSNIILFPMNNTLTTINASLTIEDNINYNIEKSLLVSEIPFIQEKQDVLQNPQYILQSQLSKSYSNSEIEIITEFTFIFEQDTFLSPSVGKITYTAFIEDDGEYISLDKKHWLTFNPSNLKFQGNPPQNSFNTGIKVKVVGDDGFTQFSDTFQVHINKLPILFVIQQITQVLGPIVGAVGFYKYRNYFYNGYFKNKNRYSKINCMVNEKFILKFPLISHEQSQAKQLIENLIKVVNKSKKRIDLHKITRKRTLRIDETDIQEIDQENQNNLKMGIQDISEGLNQQQQQQNELEQHKFQMQSIQMRTKNSLFKKSKLSFKQAKILPIKGEQEQKLTESVNNPIQVNEKKPNFELIQGQSQKKNSNNKNDTALLFISKIIKAKPYVPTTEVEKKYLKNDGKLNMEAITNDMINLNITFKLKGKQIKIQDRKEELENKQSAVYKCIKFLFARYLISLDEKTFLVSEFIRYFGKRNCFPYTQNDWYKLFTILVSEDTLDIYGQTIVFPKIQLINENINAALLLLNLVSSKDQSLKSLTNFNINPHLISTILKADALGIHTSTPSSICPSLGESFYLKSHELNSVESFKYSPGGACFSLKKMLNMEYDPYGPKENMQFPSWLQLNVQPGVILLQGTPQVQDIEEILIRFFGGQGFIYRSFTLRVHDDNGKSIQSQAVQNKMKKKYQVNKSLNELSPSLSPIIRCEDLLQQMKEDSIQEAMGSIFSLEKKKSDDDKNINDFSTDMKLVDKY